MKKEAKNSPAAQAASSSTLSLAPNPQTWSRQPKESPEAFEAFQHYLEVKETKTGGIEEVARRLKKSRALISRWSQRWKWVERVRAYENHKVLLLEREQAKAAREKSREWIKRKAEIRDLGFEVGKQMIERCVQLLKLPIFEREVKGTVVDKNGNEVPTVTILNFQQHPRDARLFAQTGLQMMRLSAEMTTENLGFQPSDVDLDSMDDEQLQAYAERLMQMRRAAQGEE